MSGFVQHGPDEFCPVMVPEGEPLVESEWWDPAPESGPPTVGRCQHCGRRGIVYEIPPVDPTTAAASDAFGKWLADAVHIGMRSLVLGAHAAAHQQLLQIHARTEAVTLPSTPRGRPVRVQQCRECRGDGWPCRTLRIIAAGHRHTLPGWSEEWTA